MRRDLTLLLAALLPLSAVAVVGGQELRRVHGDLARAEAVAGLEREQGAAARARELEQLRGERAALASEVARLEAELADLESDARGGLVRLEGELDAAMADLARRVGLSTSRLEAIAGTVDQLEADPTSAVLQDLAREVEEQWSLLEARLERTSDLVDVQRAALHAVESRVEGRRDPDRMWRELLGPTVRIAGDATVGSGVLLESRPVEDGWRTLVLTAWHVVRDVRPDGDGRVLVPVSIYDTVGVLSIEDARLLDRDPGLDVALLELLSRRPWPNGARLPRPDRLARARPFDEIYAVGCPLGNDPIPTRGEVADTSHWVDGQTYWMINAPTFIGNSGGGVFDAETHELLGIFSKIYNYGTAQQTIVPHMGLVTPMDRIYAWVEGLGTELRGAPTPAGSSGSGPLATDE